MLLAQYCYPARVCDATEKPQTPNRALKPNKMNLLIFSLQYKCATQRLSHSSNTVWFSPNPKGKSETHDDDVFFAWDEEIAASCSLAMTTRRPAMTSALTYYAFHTPVLLAG
jgi:hypothetical protein